jgi:ribosome-binding factor A
VLNAEVSPDLRSAKVYVSVMGNEKTQALSLHGLNSARGFLQSKVADRLQTRYTPILKFVLDPGVKRSVEVSQTLRETLEDGPAGTQGDTTEAEHAPAAAEHDDGPSDSEEDY